MMWRGCKVVDDAATGSVYIPFFRFSFSYVRTKDEKRIRFSFSKVK